MNVTLINPPTNDIGTSVKYPPLGLMYLASVAAENHNVKLIDAYIECLGPKKIIERIHKYDTDLLGIYTSIASIEHVTRIIKLLRQKDKKIKIVLGGPQISIEHKSYFEEHKEEIDFIVRSEGERTFGELLDNLDADYNGVKGLSYKEDDRIKVNPPRALIANLDDVPYPNWDVLPPLSYYKNTRARKWPFMPITMTRGCNERCTYCSKHVFGSRIRYRSIKNIEGEVQQLAARGIKELQFNDDNFLADRNFAEELCEMFERRYNFLLRLCNGLRSDVLDEDLILRLKRAGTYFIGVGIDSADENVLKTCRRRVDLRHAEEVFKLLKKHNIFSVAYFILGLPGETKESIQKTMRFVKKVNPDLVTYTMFAPLPGTPAYKMVHEQGRLTDYYKTHANYFGKVNWVPQGLSESYLKGINKRAYFDFFFPFKWLQSLYAVVKHSSVFEARNWLRDGLHLFLRSK